MSKKRFFIPLAAFSLLFSTVVACNANNNNQPSASGKGDESSQPAPSSTGGGGGGAASNSSQAPAHTHTYGETASSTVKNSDNKDVKLFQCTENDGGKYMAIAFGDFSEQSDAFDSAANASKYKEVAADLWADAKMLAKSSTTTISWKVSLDKAITGAKLQLGINSTYDSHGNTDVAGKFQVKVNDGSFANWDQTGTYSSIGLAPTKRTYVDFKTIDLAAGENIITIKQANQENRLLFGGDVKIFYDGEAVPVAAPFAGYDVTFSAAHCSILVYESGQDYSVDPVAPTGNKTKARDEEGNIVAYTGEAGALEPQVNFKVVPEAGYEVDTTCISVSGTQGTDWNSLKDVAGTETTIGEGDTAQKVVSENTFRITKVRGSITVTVNAVAQGTLKPGYEISFVLEHCTVNVFKEKKWKTAETDAGPKYYSRDKNADDGGDYPYCKGENAQFSFIVVPESGYEFAHGLTGEVEADDVSFISPNGYNKLKITDNLKMNLTKVSRNITITIKCTEVQAA